MEFKVRSLYEERYGKKHIPEDMTIQDWGISYAELEPYYDKFEYTAAVSGKAGNIGGQSPTRREPVAAPRPHRSPVAPPSARLARAGVSNTTDPACFYSCPPSPHPATLPSTH